MIFANALNIFGQPDRARFNVNDKVSALPEEYRLLYNKILAQFLMLCKTRAEKQHDNSMISDSLGKTQYVLIFRQSKSWKAEVETRLNQIQSTDKKINDWVNHWLTQIQDLRDWQQKVSKCATTFQQLKSQTEQDDEAIKKVKRKVLKLKNLIQNALIKAEEEVLNEKNIFKQSDPRHKIVKFLDKNWRYLTVFNEWPEVSLDEEKIAFQIRKPDPAISRAIQNNETKALKEVKSLVNESMKGIFIIEEKHQESIVEFENEKLGDYIEPVAVDIKQTFLAPESPSPRKRASPPRFRLTDELIFNVPFPEEEKVSETAREIERVVKLVLFSINQKLSESTKKQTSYFFNIYWPLYSE